MRAWDGPLTGVEWDAFYYYKVQTVLGDNKCQELWCLLQQARGADKATTHDIIRYRREAERNAGSDEKLYRFDWVSGSRAVSCGSAGVQQG